MKNNFFKKNVLLLSCIICLGVLDVFADSEDTKKISEKYAFEIERYFTILNNDLVFSAIDVYNNKSSYTSDFYKNRNKQYVSVDLNSLAEDFESINVGDYEKRGGFTYQNDHSYNLKNFSSGYSYVFDFGKNSEILLMPYLNFAFKTIKFNNSLDDAHGNISLNIFDIKGGLYALYNFLNYDDSSIFIDLLLSLNFDYTRNLTYKESIYEPKQSLADFNINFMIGLGYKTEFVISRSFGSLLFIPKISLLRIGNKMDSKNIIDRDDIASYGGDVFADYNSIYAVPSFDLAINNIFKGMLLSKAVNSLFLRFKYLIDINSSYDNSFEVIKEAAQVYLLDPKVPEGLDISLGFSLFSKKYFGYSVSYNFNRKRITFNFNLKL